MWNELYKYAVRENIGDGDSIFFETKRIQYSINLSSDGNFQNISENLSEESKKNKYKVSETFLVPRVSPNRKSSSLGIYSFLQEQVKIILNRYEFNDNDRKFNTFIDHISDFKKSNFNNGVLDPVLLFLLNKSEVEKCKNEFFKIKANPTDRFDFITKDGRVIINKNVSEYWIKKDSDYYTSTLSSVNKICVVTGKYGTTKPTIEKFGPGRGVSIASFDKNATTSYGMDQMENLPLNSDVSKKLESTLRVLDKNSIKPHKDSSMKYMVWGKKRSDVDLMSMLLHPNEQDVKNIIQSIYKDNIKMSSIIDNDFYCLIAFYNMDKRLAIKNYIYSSYETTLNNIKNWFDIVCCDNKSYGIFSCVNSIENVNEAIIDKISYSLTNSILTNSKIDNWIIQRVICKELQYKLKKEKKEVDNSNRRISMMKMFLKQNGYNMNDNVEISYMCGQLQAYLEHIVNKAMPNVNKNFVESLYSRSINNPKVSFTKLIENIRQRGYCRKIGEYGFYLEKQINELYLKIGNEYPSFMTLNDKCLFNVGYSVQMKEFFSPKIETENEIKLT